MTPTREAHLLPAEGHVRSCAESAAHPRHPLPPLAELIDQGKVVALNFPIAMNPGWARAFGTMLKQDFSGRCLAA
jgi:hypothetical protein